MANTEVSSQSVTSDDKGSRIKLSDHSGRKRGGWITTPFIIATTALLNLASGGLLANMTVYLIQEFHVKSIDAAQISNIINGCVSLFPVAGAIIADSFSANFTLISISSCLSFLGSILLTLTATIDSLRPDQRCNIQTSGCQSSRKFQLAVLYGAIGLISAGSGGYRFTIATMGADQLDTPEAQAVFFNWFFFSLYAASVVSVTAIVFVEDNVSWGLGFGLCAVANLLGSAAFISGKRYYRKAERQAGHENPLTCLARVVVAAVAKRNLPLSNETQDYHYAHRAAAPPTNTFRFLNRAAQKTVGDTKIDGSVTNPWTLCTVQQVEDLKRVIRMLPLWFSSILLGTPIAIQASMTILQALTLDRHLTPHFKLPAGSVLVWVLLSCAISISIIDRFLCPAWHHLTGHLPTPLQRIGVGHVLNVLAMAVSALVESRRLKTHAKFPTSPVVPVNVVLLFPQLILVGVGEAFHFPGQVSLYYQEFPQTLRSMSTGMVALLIGVAFYLGTAIVDLLRRVTGWLPDDINNGKLHYVYWLLVVLGVLNFVYYLVCAKLFEYHDQVLKDEDA